MTNATASLSSIPRAKGENPLKPRSLPLLILLKNGLSPAALLHVFLFERSYTGSVFFPFVVNGAECPDDFVRSHFLRLLHEFSDRQGFVP
ncbi:hypothetical protein CS022_21520 [Veronia nyctiphanis]|uniref:Uncharacterized protein n=1 Tax=Veronia nyctiphanis TaxID=1278244 RepID=A0A4Q0YKH5_9GAMM|nr:hypothetical protein [Veronia nyctiphanis]RXJ71242.1 hypothetical protein CS022_21520 [Veronia nyctiphanis]